jgi:GT2 family glycosyltransferase
MSAMDAVDVLIPTFERPAALAVTLTSVFAQTLRPARVVVSDQGEHHDAARDPVVAAVLRLLHARGTAVEAHRHLPRRGLAEQRDFLLGRARSPRVLFLDDDVILEPDLLERMARALGEHRCGFVGSALHGLSFVEDVRPHQQAIEFWDGPVKPEHVTPDAPAWRRHHLHSAANLYHVQRRLGLAPASQKVYRVAWVGGCVLYDAAKLRGCGGFGFWRELPAEHCGEDVLAQLRVMAAHGGCGLIPSGAYHQELETTVPRREVDAPRYLAVRGPPEPQRDADAPAAR